MKKNKLLITSLFLIISFLITPKCFSQKVSYSGGTEFINKNGVFKYVIGENETSFYVLRLGTKGSGVQNNIEKYNKKTFKLEWVKDVAFEKDLGGNIPSGNFLESTVILSRGKIYFFLSLLETRKNTRSVYVKTLLTDNGAILGDAQLLAKEEDYKGTEKFALSFSKDTTMVLIKSTFTPSQRKGLTTTFITANFACYKNVKLFDLKTNKEIFTKEMPSSDNNGDLGCTSVSVDNKGNLLCIYTHISKENDMFGSIARIEGKNPGIGKIPVNSTQMNSFDLNVDVNDHAYLTSNTVQYQENFDYAVLTGIFIDIPCKGRKKDCLDRKEGNFFMKIDLNKSKIISKEYQYFDDNTDKKYRELFDRNDDYKRLYCVNSIIDKVNEDVYNISVGYSETIFITRYNKDGKVIWTKVLPRSISLYYPGFAYAFEKGILYFIYLDHSKNIENIDVNNFSVKKTTAFSAATGANVICISIDKDGKLTRTLISTNEKDSANFIPNTIDYLSEQPPIYNLKNRDKEKFIRFDFQK